MQKISKIALEYCHKNNIKNISYGDLDTLHDLYMLGGFTLSNPHPINKHKAVLDALDRESKQVSAIFEKKYFRSFRGLARMFIVKETK